jgi:flagellar biosynthesis protein FlhB
VASPEEEGRTEVSARRLERAWEEGQVPLGRDAPLVVSLAASAAALLALGGALRGGLVQLVHAAADGLAATPFATLPRLAAAPALAAAAVCAAAAGGSALVTLVETKGGFWAERVVPDPSRILDPGRLGSLFGGKRALVDLGLAAVKVVALSWAAWSALRGELTALPRLLSANVADQLAFASALLWRVAWRMLVVALVIAGLDLAVVRKRFMQNMLVTKAEAARESKDDLGDPLVRGKRRQRHRELSRGRARIEVPRADALVVNPTHIAIALRYRREEGGAPRVIAKGKGALAEYMREIAREHAIPIVQDVPLARLLYRKVKVGREVPASTYKAVAAVLAFVFRLTGRAAGKGAA